MFLYHSATELIDLSRKPVEKITVVAYNNHRAIEVADGFF